MNHLVDVGLQLGGRLPSEKISAPFFVSFSTQQLSNDLGGFAVPIDVHIYRGLVEFTPLYKGAKQLHLLYTGQHVFNSQEGAMPSVAPSATTRGKQNFHPVQTHWEDSLSPSTLLSAHLGVVNAIISSDIQGGAQGISTLDLPQETVSGPAPLSLAGVRTRYQAGVGMQTISGGGVHSLALGF